MQYIPTNIPFFKALYKQYKKSIYSEEMKKLINVSKIRELTLDEKLLLEKYRKYFINAYIDICIYAVNQFSYLYSKEDYIKKIDAFKSLKRKIKAGELFNPNELEKELDKSFNLIIKSFPSPFSREEIINGRMYKYLGLNASTDLLVISAIITSLVFGIKDINKALKKQKELKKHVK